MKMSSFLPTHHTTIGKTDFLQSTINIVYCYSEYQELFKKLSSKIFNIQFHQGIPELDEISDTLVIIDDLMTRVGNRKEFLIFASVRIIREIVKFSKLLETV